MTNWTSPSLIGEVQTQMLMVAGFLMLGWVLARRQLKMRKRINQETRLTRKELQQLRERKPPALPLADAPPETLRWQGELFDLQRELKAELDTRIVIVQTLLRQVDQRIERLSQLEGGADGSGVTVKIADDRRQRVEALVRSGHTASEIAIQTSLPLGDVEMLIATL